MFKLLPLLLPLLLLLLLPPQSRSFQQIRDPNKNNPLSPRSSLIRYWNRRIPGGFPKPDFLLSKASPLSAASCAFFQKVAENNSLSTHLQSFCKSANLFCFPDASPSLASGSTGGSFSVYQNERNFSNYGRGALAGLTSFSNYSDSVNIPVNGFTSYARASIGHIDGFSNYAPGGNVANGKFSSYGAGATGGSSGFNNYDNDVNNPNLGFASYDSDGNGRSLGFSSYSDNANAGDQGFRSYGKVANGETQSFTSYGKTSNVVGSTFSNYGEKGNAAADNFTSYGVDSNEPTNIFRNYGEKANSATESFSSYRERANVGDDSFQSYAGSTNSKAQFSNYGKSFNEGTDFFKNYGKNTGFKIYGRNNTFKGYADSGTTFSGYTNRTNEELSSSKIRANRRVEPGKFFRESMLKKGTKIWMPNIADRMPKRSFLPRQLSAKIPISSDKIQQLKEIFHGAGEDSAMGSILARTVKECERKPSRGETKRCVASIEDMIDFAVSILGRNSTVKTTENVAGSNGEVEIGRVVGLNGGRVTKSVSCHQSLFPSMLYFCHSVPHVRVYEAEILGVEKKEKINHGVAICHIDTSMWGAGHGAFAALGGRPGKIEVCHWIFENDMTWVMAD